MTGGSGTAKTGVRRGRVPSRLLAVLEALQLLACATGYFLSFLGWFAFALQVCILAAGAVNPGQAPFVAERLRAIGIVLVLGWLLLRFAAGLFPFGRHFFRHSGGLR